MAQNVIQMGSSTIWFDDAVFKVNTYDQIQGRLDVVRISNNVIVCQLYNGTVHWRTPPAAAAFLSAFGGLRINLT